MNERGGGVMRETQISSRQNPVKFVVQMEPEGNSKWKQTKMVCLLCVHMYLHLSIMFVCKCVFLISVDLG
jgi:hypothetical protein